MFVDMNYLYIVYCIEKIIGFNKKKIKIIINLIL